MMTALWLCKSSKRYATHQRCAPSRLMNNGCAICGTANWPSTGRRLRPKTKSSQTVKWKRYVNAGKAPDGAPYWGFTPTALQAYPIRVLHTPNPAFFIEVRNWWFLSRGYAPSTHQRPLRKTPNTNLKSRYRGQRA